MRLLKGTDEDIFLKFQERMELSIIWLPEWDWDWGAQVINLLRLYINMKRPKRSQKVQDYLFGTLGETNSLLSVWSLFFSHNRILILSLGPYFHLSVLSMPMGTEWWPNSKLITDQFHLLSVAVGQKEGQIGVIAELVKHGL